MTRPAVVMIHGAFCAGWAFEQFRLPFEAAGYTVLAPDLRHHDRPRHAPHQALASTSVKDYAADLAALIRARGEPVILVGHSMGGLLAQMLAADGRLPVKAAILIAPSAPWGILPGSAAEIAAAQGLFMAGDFWQQVLQPTRWIAYANALDALDPAAQAHVYARFVPESGRAMFEILHWPMDMTKSSFVFPRDVRCPVFAAAGGRDRVNPAGTVKQIAARYRERGTYRLYPEMSHWMVGEPGWEDVARDALAWLAESGLQAA